MALTAGELLRIRAELGFNVLTSGAAPWVNVTAYFETIVSNYLTGGTATTSSTAVTAATSPTLVTLTLASGTGFAAGDRVWVGAGDSLESTIAQSISGTSLAVKLTKAQSGTYPVSIDGGEQIVRDLLEKIRLTKAEMGATFGEGAIKQVDDVHFFETGSSLFGSIGTQLTYWRDELASVLGVRSQYSKRRSAGSALSVY